MIKSEKDALEILGKEFFHVFKNVKTMWGTTELERYFDKIIFSDRPNRQGFPSEVMSALFFLQQEHSDKYNFKQKDPWDSGER